MIRVLLVDDEKDIRIIAKKFLSKEDPNLHVFSVDSGEEGIIQLQEGDFDVIVSDYQMPGLDGLELLERLRNEDNDIPFIMFTGRGREKVAIQALNLGADYYIRKGGDPKSQYAELAHVIRNVVHHRFAEQELTRSERELQESEEKYRAMVEQMHEGVMVSDVDGTIIFANPRVNELLGYTKEELIGQNEYSITHPSSKEKVKEETEKRPQGISSAYEMNLLSKEGKPIPVILSAIPLFTAERAFRAVLAVFTDISERKQMEKALRKSEFELSIRNRIANIFLTVPDDKVYAEVLEVILDATGSKHGIFGYINQDGNLVSPSLTKDVWDQCHMSDKTLIRSPEKWIGIWGRALKERKSFCSNDPFQIPEGHIPMQKAMAVPILHFGKVIGSLLVANKTTNYGKQDQELLEVIAKSMSPKLHARLQRKRQETKRNQMDEVLRESGLTFRRTFEAIPDPAYLWQKQSDGKIVLKHANKAAFEITKGKIADDFDGDLEELHGHEPNIISSIKHSMNTGETKREEIKRRMRTTGEEKWLLVEYAKASENQVLTITKDRTERKQTELALQESEEKYRTLFNNANDAIMLISLPEGGMPGQFIEVNEITCKRLGYSREELLTMSPKDITAPERFADLLQMDLKESLPIDEQITFETIHVTKDGRQIPVEISSHFFEMGNERVILIIARDISKRKHMEEGLQESERTFQRTFEAIADPGLLYERQPNGKIILKHANKAAIDISKGVIVDELGMDAHKLYENEPEVFSIINQVMDTGKTQREERQRSVRGTGEEKWFLIDYVRPSENRVLIIAKDITRRKQIEKVLRGSEKTFRRIFEAIPNPAFLWERQDDGRIVFTHANRAAFERTKGKIVDDIGIELEQAYANEPDVVTTIKNTMDTGEIIREEKERKLRIRGEKKWLLVEYVKTAEDRVLVISRDLTDRRKAEETLRESEKTFRRMFEAIPDPAYLIERQDDGRVIMKYANKAAFEITKGKIEEDLGRELESLPGNDQGIGSIVKQTMDTGEKKREEVQRKMRTTGENKWFLIDYVKTAEDRVLVIAKDITETKQKQQQIETQRDELHDFAQTMSHDLGNSLTVIQGYSELLEKNYDLSHVKKISKHSTQMKKLLIRSLELATAGQIINKTDEVNLNQLVTQSAELTIPENITFVRDRLPTLVCDREKVTQIFNNLFENAVIHGKPTKISVKQKEKKKGIQILITNDGQQITQENRSKLFHRGYTTKKGGLGLGLVIVKKLVKAHGWQIQLEPSPETTFRISIPIRKKKPSDLRIFFNSDVGDPNR